MAIQTITAKFTGINEILLNNPQTVDPFNKFAKEMKQITSKRKKTEDDLHELRKLEIRAKMYWDENIGVWVPSNWLVSAIAANSWNMAKIKKSLIRSCVFPTDPKLKLHYDGESKVKEPMDIVGDEKFHMIQNIKQGQVRIIKATPSFTKWSFECTLEFDDQVLPERDLKSIIEYIAKFGGFGDFRPTYGRAEVEFS